MPDGLLKGAARRVAAVSVAAVAVIAASIGVSIWRYEDALGRSAAAVDARHDAALTQQLNATFWHEHEAMNEYLVTPDPETLGEIRAERALFAATSATLGHTQPLDEARLRAQALAGERSLLRAVRTDPRGRGDEHGAPDQGGQPAGRSRGGRAAAAEPA